MAGGKTYHGLGEVEAAFRDETREGQEPREAYSGPTVVDALKVEAGLEKLRTMEPPAAGRPTAVGHSSGTPVVGQTIGADSLRGTMFGHSIHLPDVNTPDELTDAPSSGSIELLDPSAPVQLPPFPLADVLSAPEPGRPPPRLDPFRRHGEDEVSFPDEETDQLVPPRRGVLGRAALVVGGIGALGLVVAFLVRGNDADEPWSPPPASSAATSPAADQPPAPAPSVEVTPLPPRAEPSAPSPAAAPPPPAVESPRAAATPPAEPEREAEARPARKRRASRRASAEDEGAAKVSRPAKARPVLQEDPDATLPLTSLD